MVLVSGSAVGALQLSDNSCRGRRERSPIHTPALRGGGGGGGGGGSLPKLRKEPQGNYQSI